jgi:hypothetical protein
MATPCNCDTFTGNVTIEASLGIGTTAPTGALDVSGSGTTVAAFVGPTDDNQGALVLRGGTAGTSWALGHLRSTDPAPNGFALVATAGSSTLPVLVATLTGRVGIGTDTPQQALDVAGTVRCTGVLLGGDILLYGALKDSSGARTNVDSGGCYYAS